MPRLTDKQREYARIGALSRLEEIDRERAEILHAFPDLRKAQSGRAVGRTRRPPTDVVKRKMSAGMRRYWAERKAQAKKLGKGQAKES